MPLACSMRPFRKVIGYSLIAQLTASNLRCRQSKVFWNPVNAWQLASKRSSQGRRINRYIVTGSRMLLLTANSYERHSTRPQHQLDLQRLAPIRSKETQVEGARLPVVGIVLAKAKCRSLQFPHGNSVDRDPFRPTLAEGYAWSRMTQPSPTTFQILT